MSKFKTNLANAVYKLRSRKSSYEIDMCNGPLLGKMIKFAIPLALSSVIQLLFHAADIIVVGQYAGETALAAVGSTAAITNLFVTVFMGLSVGTNVLTARYYGSEKYKDLSEVVHTSVAMSLIFGVVLIILGQFLSAPILALMGTPEDVIGQSTLYMRIIFGGMPALMLYNFGAAILRAVGDTKRPLYFLTLSGILNVLVNLFLVIIIGMGVEGVAIATILSQYVSAVLVLLCLVRNTAVYSVVIKDIRIHKDKLIQMLKIGLPAGIQGAMFSFSNALIQSSINSFGSTVMAGSTAAGNLEGFVFVALNAFHQTAVTFVSQNIGGKKYSRVPKITLLSLGCVMVVGVVLGVGMYLLGVPLLSIYNSDPEVIAVGMIRLGYIGIFYFACGLMDVMIGVLRGMGYSISTMFTSLIGVCGLRIAWIYTFFQATNSLEVLFSSYPITWTVTALVSVIQFIYAYKRMPKETLQSE